jgi:cytoskeletal protein CcmA (bactofilin family)
MTKHEETPQVNVNEVCRISNGIRLKGDMISQNDIRIDGFYKGNIFTAGKVVLGENGEIEGNVFCANA